MSEPTVAGGQAAPSRASLWARIRRVWVTTGIVVTVVFVIGNALAYHAWGVPAHDLESDARVNVFETAELIRFEPTSAATPGDDPAVVARRTGLLFFAGALVSPHAYVPMARRLAEEGRPVAIVKLPARCLGGASCLPGAVARARDFMRRHGPGRWVVGGHSRGAAAAVMLVARDGAGVDGLLLVGSSHPRETDLQAFRPPVTKVFGTRDGLADTAEVRRYAMLLPPQTRFVPVVGGNHAQFGWYGPQFGDHRATITRQQQQMLLLDAIRALLRKADAHPEAGVGDPSRLNRRGSPAGRPARLPRGRADVAA